MANDQSAEMWRYPIPGDWLKVRSLESMTDGELEIGDNLYFRMISPMGLFECYSPKIQGLYWVAPENVEANRHANEKVPAKFTVNTLFDIITRGMA